MRPTNTQRPQSPNNSLASRTNQPRVNGRVADIFGTVEATPDLLAVPYVLYQNNVQVEIGFMSLGRGSYDVSRVRDGDTSVASIAGSSAAIYAPFTSPNSGDAPQLQIGSAIAEPVLSVVKLNEVNGQTLKPTNVNRIQGEDSIRFVYPDSIQKNDDTDFTDYFSAGDAISISQANISGEVGTDTIQEDAKFTYAGEIVFSSFDPTTVYEAGQQIAVSNAGYAANVAQQTQYIQSGEKNLFDASTVTEGYEMYGDGSTSPQADSSVSAPIYVGHLKEIGRAHV